MLGLGHDQIPGLEPTFQVRRLGMPRRHVNSIGYCLGVYVNDRSRPWVVRPPPHRRRRLLLYGVVGGIVQQRPPPAARGRVAVRVGGVAAAPEPEGDVEEP
ncbi:hypothetical protein PG994_003549 [Apiospora phragmitis]|uniref:Uncharacterized protein n=1 Tax=Apiospora phragmitis TaxID=2905665 RepID=A0ABR1VYG9_9PEZI